MHHVDYTYSFVPPPTLLPVQKIPHCKIPFISPWRHLYVQKASLPYRTAFSLDTERGRSRDERKLTRFAEPISTVPVLYLTYHGHKAFRRSSNRLCADVAIVIGTQRFDSWQKYRGIAIGSSASIAWHRQLTTLKQPMLATKHVMRHIAFVVSTIPVFREHVLDTRHGTMLAHFLEYNNTSKPAMASVQSICRSMRRAKTLTLPVRLPPGRRGLYISTQLNVSSK